MNTQKGNIATYIIIGAIIVIIAVTFLIKKPQRPATPYSQTPTENTTVGGVSGTPQTNTGGVQGNANTSVDTNLQAVDTNIKGLTNDSASIDSGINDKQIPQPE